ncbi:N-acyl-D-amino-acid deacylase family protein [Pseudonocardia acaciae]|uniref:N-acyl-D-amino-acid deacylase family protein n=1 Tax=Pseudonocardia acaciae TaxID=551276 RepID=UPI000491E48C|nr:amidohydrolase family protein [Pseudonocardia acaciae]
MLDLLITNGTVVDGTGREPFHADVGVAADRIALIRPNAQHEAARRIDASGLTVTPGFIDPHSHSDWSILGNRKAQSTIRQGVTTEVVGNCGVTYAPLAGDDHGVAEARAALRAFGYDGEVGWRSFGDYLDHVHGGQGTAQNLYWFVGHTALRNAAGVRGDTVTAGQAEAMRRLLDEALDAGAAGMSTGLEYGSGREAGTDELLDLASVLGRRGARYASHIRNRDARLGESVDEFFRIARGHGLTAQLSHLNVRSNTGAAPGAWDDAVERLHSERSQGLDVLADMTPYPDGLGMATGILPAWLLADGPAHAAELLADRQVRTALRADCDRYWRFIHRGEWHRVTLATSPATPELEGLSFPEIARRLGRDEWDCYFDILRAAGPNMFGVQLMGRLFDDDHVAAAIAHPLFCLGVDGYTSRLDGPLAARTRHPLFFRGHLHYLAHHVLRRRTLTLADAVYKMTGMVAEHFGLAGRGVLAEGAFADLAVLDTAALAALDTFAVPEDYPAGVPHVVVNGQPVVDRGEHTGARAGRHLRPGRTE